MFAFFRQKETVAMTTIEFKREFRCYLPYYADQKIDIDACFNGKDKNLSVKFAITFPRDESRYSRFDGYSTADSYLSQQRASHAIIFGLNKTPEEIRKLLDNKQDLTPFLEACIDYCGSAQKVHLRKDYVSSYSCDSKDVSAQDITTAAEASTSTSDTGQTRIDAGNCPPVTI